MHGHSINGTDCDSFFLHQLDFVWKPNSTTLEFVNQLSQTLVAILILPVSIVSLLACITLLLLLAIFVKRPQHFDKWGLVIGFVDLLFIIFQGFIHLTSAYAMHWWGWDRLGHAALAHTTLGCIIVSEANTFLYSLRLNLLVAALLYEHQLGSTSQSSKQPRLFLPCLAAVSTATVLVIAPHLLVVYPWQLEGQFRCGPDPIWSRAYWIYAKLHFALICDGLLPSFALLVLVRQLARSLQGVQRQIDLFQCLADHIDVMKLIMLPAISAMQQKVENGQLLVELATSLSLTRLVQGSLGLTCFTILLVNPPQHLQRCDQFGVYSLRDLMRTLELAGISLTFPLWLYRLTPLRSLFNRLTWKQLIGCLLPSTTSSASSSPWRLLVSETRSSTSSIKSISRPEESQIVARANRQVKRLVNLNRLIVSFGVPSKSMSLSN